ncbi:uracil-DNA glycosylase [Deinococcus sp.]|uniref:uracil-DNA glycosylase n=1 Tax=Deinococcus sp. TaxID=47478 RepID=UPI0025CBCEDC|nr:uracil-DNA glycosylase [Deinococcus sp.]
MTQANTIQLFRSNSSGRNIVPGWMQLNPSKPDTIEIQVDLDASDLGRAQATLLIEYWPNPGELGLQSLLPVRAFTSSKEGWCLLVPAQGQVLIRAIDTEPSPPLLSAHGITLEPATPVGTVVNVKVNFPDSQVPNDVSGLQLNS